MPLILVLALPLALPLLGCEGDGIDNIIDPPPFEFEPQFNRFNGGVGVASSPLAGVWQLRLNASSNGNIPAQTINFVPQVYNDTNGDPTQLVGFALAPTRRANVYVEGELTDSNVDLQVYIYEPSTKTVNTFQLDGLLDIGLGTVTNGTYDSDTRVNRGSNQEASGTFTLTIADETDEDEFPAFENGVLPAIDFLAASGLGQEDTILFGRITPTLNGGNATATITVTAHDSDGASLGSATFNATGTFNDTTNVLDLTNISGTIGAVDFTGRIRLTLVNVGNSTMFPATGFASGTVLLEAEEQASGTLAGDNFGGTAGTSSAI